MDEPVPVPEPALVAAATLGDPTRERPIYKSAQWSADGTTVITSTSDNTIASYVLPVDLLSEDDSDESDDEINDDESDDSNNSSSSSSTSSSSALTRQCRRRLLSPQGRLALPEPALAIAPAPYFSLVQPSTQSALVSCRDHPIQLHTLFPDDESQVDLDDSDSELSVASGHSQARARPRPRPPPMASYPLIKAETEAFLAPTALLWPSPGTHFVAGTANLLALFDASRTANDPPLLHVPTIPSTRHIRKGNGVGMRGTVSALAGSIDGPSSNGDSAYTNRLVAAGTWTRWVGLYDLARAGGQSAATWSVADSTAQQAGGQGGSSGDGGGIMQVLWSPCGRYLVINERRSRGLLVYDIRVTGALLCHLTGRPAETNQRLNCDVYSGGDAGSGFEVWAGTQDGTAVVWQGVGRSQDHRDSLEPSWSWKAHSTAMGSTALHASGSVVATCSGSWIDDGRGIRTSAEASLKIWSLT